MELPLAFQARELSAAVFAARKELTLGSAEEVCRVSRDFWFTFHEQWLTNHGGCLRFQRAAIQDLQIGLDAIEAIRANAPAAGLSPEAVALLGKYSDSVRFRLSLMELLAKAPSPREGARMVYDQVRKQLAS